MADLTRRSFLHTVGLTAAASTLPVGLSAVAPAASAAETASGGVETFGTAALTAAIVGMSVDGDTAYIVTRGQTPPKLVTVDLAARRVETIVRLGRGDGGWATTMSGGQVYAGTYPTPDLYRYDPATGEVTLLGTIGPSGGFVWCLTTAPDGTVYAGTSPRGEVWEYRPDTGALRNLGRALPSATYVRVIAADDRFVYAGTLPTRSIMAYDRVTGAKTDILPPEISRAGGVDALVATGTRVIASVGGQVIDLAPDGSDARILTAPGGSTIIDAMMVGADGVLYATARRTGSVYRRSGDTLELIGSANVGDETRTLALQGSSTLVGGAGSGVIWYHDLDDGSTELFDLTDTDVAGPDLVQSIALDEDRAVYVGGHYYITSHQPWSGTSRRTRVAGEPKALLPMGDAVLAALYPSSEIIALDPRSGQVRSYGHTGYQRPWELAHDPRRQLVLVASAPGTGLLQGALSVLDLRTGELAHYPEVLPDQGVMSVTIAHGVAYLAGDTWGGGSVPPTRSTSQVAAFDLDTRTVLWRREPLPAMPSIQHVEVEGDTMYGVCKRVSGTWFAMDLPTGEILAQGKLSGYGEIVRHRGQVFAAANFGDNIYRLGPGLDQAELLTGPIPTSWYTVPQLEFERRTWRAWGVADRKLARFDLAPR